jgi:hypothetical protein
MDIFENARDNLEGYLYKFSFKKNYQEIFVLMSFYLYFLPCSLINKVFMYYFKVKLIIYLIFILFFN